MLSNCMVASLHDAKDIPLCMAAQHPFLSFGVWRFFLHTCKLSPHTCIDCVKMIILFPLGSGG